MGRTRLPPETRLIAIALLLAGCGRVGFAERADGRVDVAAGSDAPPVVCPATYVALDATPRRYRLDATPMFWMDAAASCAADGEHLFVPDDANEMTMVLLYIGPVPTGNTVPDGSAWIGIDDLAVEGDYVTESGLPAPYLPWEAGQPDNSGNLEDCVHVLPGGLLNDLQCDGFTLPSVCECP